MFSQLQRTNQRKNSVRTPLPRGFHEKGIYARPTWRPSSELSSSSASGRSTPTRHASIRTLWCTLGSGQLGAAISVSGCNALATGRSHPELGGLENGSHCNAFTSLTKFKFSSVQFNSVQFSFNSVQFNSAHATAICCCCCCLSRYL